MAEANIAVRVGAKVDQFKKDMGSASKSLDKFGRDAKQGAKQAAKYGAAATAAGAAIATHLVKQSLKAIDAQAKLAKQLDTSVKSLAVLERAGQLSGVSMKQIGVASRTLSVRIGEAEQGTGEAVKAFEQLRLKASDLAKLPLDERLQKINKAMLDHVPAAQRAAVASDLFGTRAATAMKMLDNDALEVARKQAELFGTALSDVDAAKVEQANDAMSVIGVAIDGAAKQLTVELAPILKATADLFLENAEEAGGMGNAVKDGMDTAIKVAGFAADAIDGVKRAFSVTADGIIISIQGLILGAQTGLEELALLADNIPGVDMSESIANLQGFKNDSIAIIQEAKAHIDETLMAPLPSEGFTQWVEEARVAGEKAAQAVTDARVTANQEGWEAVNENNEANWAAELERVTEHSNQLAEVARQAEEQKTANEIRENNNRKQAASNALGDLSSLMSTENKKQFEIGKKASIAQAAISTIEGAQNAFTSLASIPYVGPALGVAAAAAAIAAGNARIQSIESQSFGGGGSVSSGGGGGSSAAAPAAAAPQRNISLSGISPTDFVQSGTLIDALNEEMADGGNLNIEFA